MASEASFTEAAALVLAFGAFLLWVVSDVLEEQMLGKPRRERGKAARAREQAPKRRAAPRPRDAALPSARVHRGS